MPKLRLGHAFYLSHFGRKELQEPAKVHLDGQADFEFAPFLGLPIGDLKLRGQRKRHRLQTPRGYLAPQLVEVEAPCPGGPANRLEGLIGRFNIAGAASFPVSSCLQCLAYPL